MTLDEAIKDIEEIAEENQRVVDTGIVFDDVTIDMFYCDDTEVIEEHLANYQKCAEEHRQLAEWLKELKQLREQTRWTPVDTPPKQSERYLAQTTYNLMCVVGYAKDLYEVDKFDFCDDKGKSGWYDYDGEYGYYKIEDVEAWMPLPKPYRK